MTCFFSLIENFIQCVLKIFTSTSFSEIKFSLPYLPNFVSFCCFVCFLLNPLSPNDVSGHSRICGLLLEALCTLYVLVSWVLWTKGNAMICSILHYLGTDLWEVGMKKWQTPKTGKLGYGGPGSLCLWTSTSQPENQTHLQMTAQGEGLGLSRWDVSAEEHSQAVRRGICSCNVWHTWTNHKHSYLEGFAILSLTWKRFYYWDPWHGCAHVNNAHSLRNLSTPHNDLNVLPLTHGLET